MILYLFIQKITIFAITFLDIGLKCFCSTTWGRMPEAGQSPVKQGKGLYGNLRNVLLD